MDPVLVFRHGDDIPLGLLGEALEVAAVSVVEVMLNHGDPIPPLEGFSEHDQPVVVFHQDSWDLPPGATLLAATDRFDHTFRMGSAVAIQAHPEAGAAIVSKWVDLEAERPLLEAAGVDPEDLVAEVRDGEPAQREMAARLFGAWAEEVVAGSR